MNIALFDPSTSFRAFFKASVQGSIKIAWQEFNGLCDNAIHALNSQKFDVVVTAKELASGSYSDLTQHLQSDGKNVETPIFLFSSDCSASFIDKAFQKGVTEVFEKQNLSTVAKTFQRMISFTTSTHGAQVLLVEDDNAVAQYYSEAMRNFGFKVEHATSCDEASKVLKHKHVELVITDLNLGQGGQGQRIIREIRHHQVVSQSVIPIMVLSGSPMQQHQTGLFYLGIDEYLAKPVPPQQLCMRAVHLIQKYRAQKTAHEQVHYFQEAAYYDKLTRAYNRHGFLELAQRCMNTAVPHQSTIGILYLDLDNFKPANDYYGHAAGDKVLGQTASILKARVRDQDIVSRWGGDEFVVLLYDCDENLLEKVAKRIQDEFKTKQDTLFGVSASIGLALGAPTAIRQLLELIDLADQAMYRSKAQEEGKITLHSTVRRKTTKEEITSTATLLDLPTKR